jgi:hypothetical protein
LHLIFPGGGLLEVKGSRKNKFTILGVEALGCQGAKMQEYQAYSQLLQRSQTGWIGG